MSERWMRESINILKGAIEKFKDGNEGDFKQALIVADHATEIIMRNFLIFKENETPPYNYPHLLRRISKKASIPAEVFETIETFRQIRDGFCHQSIEKIKKGLKGTTTGLTLERSYIKDYLKAACQLFESLTSIEMTLGES